MLALIFADRRGLLLAQGGDLSRYDGQLFAVVRVVDGDTLDVAAPDGDSPVTRIRLWGIDTPELSRSATTPNEPFADEATDFARQLLDGQQVRLILEPHDQRDKYGRLLAYVQLPDGTLFNERLLAAGLARYEDRFSHRHMQRFAMLELQARNEKVGLWNPRP
jgi:micrococcal nuclease